MGTPNSVGLPPRPFMYTIDQISVLTQFSEETLFQQHLYLDGRTIGTRKPHEMIARNMAPPDKDPDWRVMEKELVRWLKMKGIRYYDRGYATV